MNHSLLQPHQLPGYHNGRSNWRVNGRSARLARQYGGRIVPFKALPQPARLALIHYMAIDGEAWELAPPLLTLTRRDPGKPSKMQRALPFYTRQYGTTPFGFITALPIKALIESCMKDQDVTDWSTWTQYHEWYMGRGGGEAQPKHRPKHRAPARDLWPVILSPFPNETLEDGWTRFHQYADRGLKACPAIWFPRDKEATP